MLVPETVAFDVMSVPPDVTFKLVTVVFPVVSIFAYGSQEKTAHSRQKDRHWGGWTLCRVVGKTFISEKTVAGKGDTVLQISYPEKQSTALFTAKAIRR